MSKASTHARRWVDSLTGKPAPPLGAEDKSELGSLLATLAEEVNALEAERAAPGYKTLHVTETYNDNEAGRHVAALVAENARLRAALEAAKVECMERCHAGRDGAEGCGADEHNNRIDDALKGDQ